MLDADISGFFDNLSHSAIMRELSDVVADGNILRLVEKFLRAGVMEGGKFRPTRVGTPQGGVAVAVAGQHRSERSRLASPRTAAIALCVMPMISWCSAEARTKPKRLWHWSSIC